MPRAFRRQQKISGCQVKVGDAALSQQYTSRPKYCAAACHHVLLLVGDQAPLHMQEPANMQCTAICMQRPKEKHLTIPSWVCTEAHFHSQRRKCGNLVPSETKPGSRGWALAKLAGAGKRKRALLAELGSQRHFQHRPRAAARGPSTGRGVTLIEEVHGVSTATLSLHKEAAASQGICQR